MLNTLSVNRKKILKRIEIKVYCGVVCVKFPFIVFKY